MLSPSQTTWAPPGVPWGLGLQGLRETTGWQEGEAMEDVLPETLGDRLMGRSSGIWNPGEPVSQHKEASVNPCHLLK